MSTAPIRTGIGCGGRAPRAVLLCIVAEAGGLKVDSRAARADWRNEEPVT